jgi:hypothetical protein
LESRSILSPSNLLGSSKPTTKNIQSQIQPISQKSTPTTNAGPPAQQTQNPKSNTTNANQAISTPNTPTFAQNKHPPQSAAHHIKSEQHPPP